MFETSKVAFYCRLSREDTDESEKEKQKILDIQFKELLNKVNRIVSNDMIKKIEKQDISKVIKNYIMIHKQKERTTC